MFIAANNNLNAQDFLLLGLEAAGFRNHALSDATKMRRYISEYGSGPHVHAAMFNDMKTLANNGNAGQGTPLRSNPIQFLLACDWLKNYSYYTKLASKYKKQEATCGKWIWYYVEKINELFELKIVWTWHANQNNPNEIFIASVDGTHCRINEPGGFDRRYKSHKHGKAALNYEVGLHLSESKIVHVCGPTFQQNDGTVSQRPDGIQAKVPAGKKIIADKIYIGYGNCFSTPNNRDPEPLKKFKDRARSRHETVNARLKKFRVLSATFHHKKELHGAVFRAVCVIVQYEMDLGTPLFDI